MLLGLVAQLGERCVRNAEVMGSNPTRSTSGKLPLSNIGDMRQYTAIHTPTAWFRMNPNLPTQKGAKGRLFAWEPKGL